MVIVGEFTALVTLGLEGDGEDSGGDQDGDEEPELPAKGLNVDSVENLFLRWPVLGPEEESEGSGEEVGSNE